jgi:hypothetical protein
MIMQLQGRGTYGPRVPVGRGVSPLWQYFRSPPAQNSLIIYKDGSVWEKSVFDTTDIEDPDVYRFILGGTDFRCTETSFEYASLTAAGYTWREIAVQNEYTDMYSDNYVQDWDDGISGMAVVLARQAAQKVIDDEAARLAEIARLEAELTVLRGY